MTYLGDGQIVHVVLLLPDHRLPGPGAQLAPGLRADADVALAAPAC